MSGYVEGVPLDQQCWHHGPEPIPDTAYRVCGECGHRFATERDLIDAEHQVHVDDLLAGYVTEVPPRRHGSVVYSCPLCTHDF